jgi:redox-sensitive bicupin YhaK (pirin superfamily)
MTTATTRKPATTARRIVHRTRGSNHGAITRLVSPGDLGELLKPFVFVDLFDTTKISFGGFGLHPHSGIATVTYLFEGDSRYEDTTGATGALETGSVEWFKAAHGAWHGGGPGTKPTRGFQLWLALPPDQELGDIESINLAPDAVARSGPARVLVGSYGAAASPLRAPGSINYLALHLRAGETWSYQPPADHSIAWTALAKGRVRTSEQLDAGELAIFEPGSAPIEFVAEQDSEFVLGSAAPHRHDLVLGRYSVHTSAASLRAGERRILDIRDQLRAQGRL